MSEENTPAHVVATEETVPAVVVEDLINGGVVLYAGPETQDVPVWCVERWPDKFDAPLAEEDADGSSDAGGEEE